MTRTRKSKESLKNPSDLTRKEHTSKDPAANDALFFVNVLDYLAPFLQVFWQSATDNHMRTARATLTTGSSGYYSWTVTVPVNAPAGTYDFIAYWGGGSTCLPTLSLILKLNVA